MFICIVLFDMRHGCIEISVLACRDRGPGSMTCGKSEKKKVRPFYVMWEYWVYISFWLYMMLDICIEQSELKG